LYAESAKEWFTAAFESAIHCSVCSRGGLACYGLILRFAPALWQCHLHRIHGRG
jgi:hypothetical protein